MPKAVKIPSKVRNPVQNRSIERKERLIDAAYELVKQKGYSETGIRDIVDAANVSIGTFYAYYKDKYDITFEILKKYGEETYGQLAEAVIAILPAEAKLSEIVYRILLQLKKTAMKNQKLHKEFFLLSLTDKKFGEAVRENEVIRIQIEFQKLISYFKEGKKIKNDPISLILVQRVIDDITTYATFSNLGDKEEKLILETSVMVANYLYKEK
ncbi:TetR/AcrR family transcriptional regulator [Leptospira bouyouniensis]|uniref:TetR/AcrR family transcriptional regulator n=1 Tax=Leptospira bouyouniensis TaxID=2484911 RepID=A0ABY2L243_9LEPT|nr:TetR/AcrR family transcriptional regulator [Leptospira bouyouniensis]TGK47327.1 TetR/AcrR family transcriptional regulator [Leptospira bouyouniensis]TGM79771.1 TetR/AcrR family transcriptional regulator [Leptospira bouyouniensis]